MKRINKIISVVLVTLIAVSVLVILYLKMSNSKVFTLVSSSMEPSLKEGSLLFNQTSAFDDIEIGDIITYKVKNSDIYITHRVSEIDDINKRILCKGDANANVDDSFIDYTQYKGTLKFYIPFAGSMVMFMHGTFGKVLGLIIVCGLLISVGYDVYKKYRKV